MFTSCEFKYDKSKHKDMLLVRFEDAKNESARPNTEQ